jgi:hypothetical protein
MKIWNLTMEKVLQLRQELDEKIKAVDELDKRSITDIWVEDLTAIEAALDERDLEKAAQLGEERKAQLKSQNLQKQRAKKGPTKSAKKKKLVVMNSKETSSDGVVELSDSDEDYVLPPKQQSKNNTLPNKDVGKVRLGDSEESGKPSGVSTSPAAVQLVTNSKEKNEEEQKMHFADIVPTASASSVKVAVKKRPSPKERTVEDEFDFGFSSSGTKNKVEGEAKKMRRGNTKTAKGMSKKSAVANPPENVVASSESQPSFSRPQRSRAAASKINYAIDLIDSDEDKKSDEDKESDFE